MRLTTLTRRWPKDVREQMARMFRADKGRTRGHGYAILDAPTGEVLFPDRVLDPSAK